MSYENQFEVGKTYRTRGGDLVTIIAESDSLGPNYRCVQGNDGMDIIEEDPCFPGIYEIIAGTQRGWRYDRASDAGRCTGSAFDMSDPRNLIPGAVLDGCQRCQGERGGVPGNENIVDGVRVCDYCTVDALNAGTRYTTMMMK